MKNLLILLFIPILGYSQLIKEEDITFKYLYDEEVDSGERRKFVSDDGSSLILNVYNYEEKFGYKFSKESAINFFLNYNEGWSSGFKNGIICGRPFKAYLTEGFIESNYRYYLEIVVYDPKRKISLLYSSIDTDEPIMKGFEMFLSDFQIGEEECWSEMGVGNNLTFSKEDFD